MSPAPRPKHQESAGNLSGPLRQFVKERGLGKVYYAPIDVILPGLANPVQPDVLFIARERLDIVKDEFIEGPPDLIVEILSPSNWLTERRTKFRIYAQASVREYWIVDTDARTLGVFVLRGSSFALVGKLGPGETVPSEVVAGFEIGVDEICPA